MIAAQHPFLSALRDRRRARAQRRAERWERLLDGRAIPLPSAIDAERREDATDDAGILSYYVDSATSGRPLVLLHRPHPAASSFELRPLFEAFRGLRPVYALDLPGFGFSDRGVRAYTPALYERAIEQFLSQVSAFGVDLLACSLACEYAAKVAVDRPELVRSLVLISPTGFAGQHELSRLERRARAGRAPKLTAGLWARLVYQAWMSRPGLSLALQRTLERGVDPGFFAYAYATSHQAGAFRAGVPLLFGALYPARDPLDVYARVSTPALVLYDHDPRTGFAELAPFAAAHPNFRLEHVAHTRGLPQFDAPEQTAEALRGFFKMLDLQNMWVRGMGATRFVGSA